MDILYVIYLLIPLILGLLLLRLILEKGPRFITIMVDTIFDCLSPKKRYQKELEDFEKSFGGFTIQKVDKMSGTDFEKFVEILFARIDHDKIIKTERTPDTGDQGCDIIVRYKNDAVLGIQCKRHASKVDNKAVQNIVSAKAIYNLTNLMVVTNNYYTQSAIEAAKANKVTLVNREGLIKWLKLYRTVQPINSFSNMILDKKGIKHNM